jgi:hypothetical protein
MLELHRATAHDRGAASAGADQRPIADRIDGPEAPRVSRPAA